MGLNEQYFLHEELHKMSTEITGYTVLYYLSIYL